MQKPMMKQNLIAFYSLVYKEINRFMRIWTQTLLPSAIMSTLYFLIFGHLMGSRIGDMNGVSYIQYIVPGLIMMTVINNSYANVVFSFFSAKFQRNIEELLVSPTPNLFILLGYVAGGVLRGILAGIIVTMIALFFTDLSVANWLLTLLVALLTAILFSTAGLINAIYANSFDDANIVPTFFLSPLIYLGGVFYSIHMLPDIWKGISLMNPILYIVNAFRYSVLNISDINIFIALSLLLSVVAILFAWALYLLKAGSGLRK